MRLIGTISLLFFCYIAKGQGQLGLYQMHGSVPQSNQVNPAFNPDSKIVIGLPVISSTYLGASSPLSYNDIFVRGSDDSLRLNSESILRELNENNKVEVNANVGLLYFGLQTKAGYFSLTYNSRVDAGFSVPGQFIEVLLSGPDDPQDVTSLTLNELNLNSSWFNEVGINYAMNISGALTLGVRLKYLMGISNIYIDGLNGSIETSIDSINISMQPWSLHTSGISNLENPSTSLLWGTGNNGWAVDLGMEYQLSKNLKLSAAALDLGVITWTADTSYFFDEVNYSFDGFDLLQLIESNADDIITQELDSLGDLFTPDTLVGTTYKTPLVSKFYVGATYSLGKRHEFGLIFAGQVFQKNFQPLIGLTYNIKLGRVINAGVNFSYRNQSFGNFGAGLSANLGPIQIYGLVDSFDALIFKTLDARIVSVRLGLNIIMGNAREKPGR